MRSPPDRSLLDDRCASCGYSLRGVATTLACPECGSRDRVAPDQLRKTAAVLAIVRVISIASSAVPALFALMLYRPTAVSLIGFVMPALLLASVAWFCSGRLFRHSRALAALAIVGVAMSCGGSCGLTASVVSSVHRLAQDPRDAVAVMFQSFLFITLAAVLVGVPSLALAVDATRERKG